MRVVHGASNLKTERSRVEVGTAKCAVMLFRGNDLEESGAVSARLQFNTMPGVDEKVYMTKKRFCKIFNYVLVKHVGVVDGNLLLIAVFLRLVM